jgi:DNA-directed RNA polymerase subunit RPC12/RpoP
MNGAKRRKREPEPDLPTIPFHFPVADTPAPAAARPERSQRLEGVRCPDCNCAHLPTLYTRHQGNTTTRVRVCRHCGRRIVTRERLAGSEPGQ